MEIILYRIFNKLYQMTNIKPKEKQKLDEAIPLAFPKPVDGDKIQACTQRTNEPMHDNYNRLKIVFKENFRCPSDTESTRGFLTMFKMASMKISTLLANWTQFIWETMATPDLVKLAKQLAQTIKNIKKKKKKERKATKIMNFQLP